MAPPDPPDPAALADDELPVSDPRALTAAERRLLRDTADDLLI